LKQEKKEPHNYWNSTLQFWSKQRYRCPGSSS
jgi:hypothetical protein